MTRQYTNGRSSSLPRSCPPTVDFADWDIRAYTGTNGHHPSFFEDYGVWKDAPVLTGTTRFEPLPGVKNIMITGGAGFMYARTYPPHAPCYRIGAFPACPIR